jgi:hypothetical protein
MTRLTSDERNIAILISVGILMLFASNVAFITALNNDSWKEKEKHKNANIAGGLFFAAGLFLFGVAGGLEFRRTHRSKHS